MITCAFCVEQFLTYSSPFVSKQNCSFSLPESGFHADSSPHFVPHFVASHVALLSARSLVTSSDVSSQPASNRRRVLARTRSFSEAGKMPIVLVAAAAVPLVAGVFLLLHFLLQLNRRKVSDSHATKPRLSHGILAAALR